MRITDRAFDLLAIFCSFLSNQPNYHLQLIHSYHKKEDYTQQYQFHLYFIHRLQYRKYLIFHMYERLRYIHLVYLS